LTTDNNKSSVFIADTGLSLPRSTSSPQINPPALTASVGAFQDLQLRAGLPFCSPKSHRYQMTEEGLDEELGELGSYGGGVKCTDGSTLVDRPNSHRLLR